MAENRRGLEVRYEGFAERADAIFGSLESRALGRTSSGADAPMWSVRDTALVTAPGYYGGDCDSDEGEDIRDGPRNENDSEEEEEEDEGAGQEGRAWRTRGGDERDALREMARREGYDEATGMHASRAFCTALEREGEEDGDDVMAAGKAGPESRQVGMAEVAKESSGPSLNDGSLEEKRRSIELALRNAGQHG